MGIFDALNTAVTGLQAQSFALQNISGNIANSQTVAYKGTDTSFEDLLSDQGTAPSQQTAGSVLASSASTITVQGDIQSTSVATNMAIDGDGFFVVQKPTSFAAGTPTFNGVEYYTRAGDFQVQDGYLVNSAGYYLMGVPIDPATGNPAGSVPQLLQFQNNFLPAQATTTVQYGANLPTQPVTTDTNASVADSDLLNPADFVRNPVVGSGSTTLIGQGASLEADADASITGTADTSSYTVPAGGVPLVLNGVTINLAATDTAAQIATAITGSAANVTASIGANNEITLTSNDASTAVDIGTGSDAGLLSGLGLSVGTTEPTNLLTQNAATSGDNMIIQFGSQPATTITFGTGAGDVATLAQFEAALTTQLNGGTGSIAESGTGIGDLTLTSTNPADTITVTGSATPSVFGLQATTAEEPDEAVIGSDLTTFLNQSVGGGAITAYNNAGSPANVQFRWAMTGNNTWNLFYQTNSSATGDQASWVNVGTNFTFGANGSLDPPISSVTLPSVTVDGVNVGNVQLSFGSGGLTQFADTNGTVNVNLLQQNGYAAGALQTLAVSGKGNITGAYSNGQTVGLAQVTLATFSGEDFLENVSGGAYAQTDESGVPVYNATGTITPGSIEGSNTDIADQFTQLIVTQQAYSANARVITTANTMLQVLINMFQ